jgi:hypothetical protein
LIRQPLICGGLCGPSGPRWSASEQADFVAAASGIKVPAATPFAGARSQRPWAGPGRIHGLEKVSNAVERNHARARRRLREVVRLNRVRLRPGMIMCWSGGAAPPASGQIFRN